MMGDQPDITARARRFPPWLKKRIPSQGEAAEVSRLLAELKLATVCSRAHCPNLPECYARGTATFLILGDSCTRSCRFCAIEKAAPGPLRDDEPEAVAEASARLGLRHVVITSVTRDDLPDGGAAHFARTIRAVRARLPQAIIEVLTPDFRGAEAAIDAVLAARPDLFNHNVETVPRLYATVRPEADYRRSLGVLAYAKRRATAGGMTVYTKSGLMVGLGETADEVRTCLADLRAAGCDPDDGAVPGAVFGAPAGRAIRRARSSRRGRPRRGHSGLRPWRPGRSCGAATRRRLFSRRVRRSSSWSSVAIEMA